MLWLKLFLGLKLFETSINFMLVFSNYYMNTAKKKKEGKRKEKGKDRKEKSDWCEKFIILIKF